jgi:flagellar biosynthesis protein FlhB
VLAKGRDHLAQEIKDVARWANIPIMENPPLAQALYRLVSPGQEIPVKLYTAVAEILAMVYRAQQQTRPGNQPPGNN